MSAPPDEKREVYMERVEENQLESRIGKSKKTWPPTALPAGLIIGDGGCPGFLSWSFILDLRRPSTGQGPVDAVSPRV
jgi:hypothetical protein